MRNSFVERWYDDVWNNGKEEAIDLMFHPQGKAHGIAGDALEGPGGFKSFFHSFRNDFSDINVKVEDVITEGDEQCYKQVARCSVTARHNASGKSVSFTGITIACIENNQLTEGWNNFDFLTMTEQLK
jgi:predicted ester cyclase